MWSVSKSTHWQTNTSCSFKTLCSWGFSRKYLVWLETPWKQGWAGTVLPEVTDNPLHMEQTWISFFISCCSLSLNQATDKPFIPQFGGKTLWKMGFSNWLPWAVEKALWAIAAIPRRPSLSSQPVPPESFHSGGIFGQVLQPCCEDMCNPRASQENEGSCTF